jgi:AcrR family transcriptional regulator
MAKQQNRSRKIPRSRRIPRRQKRRAEQERARGTRLAILAAALSEFAEKGFEAASIRSIAARSGLQHPLITYHFPSKELLWRATAKHAFSRISEKWEELLPTLSNAAPLTRLRAEYRALFDYTIAFPEFHRFMRQEAFNNNPRLKWVAETVVRPLIDRLLPQIEAAQEAGQIPTVEPILFHYMMVSLTATLSGFGPEMGITSGIAADRRSVAEAYWRLVERMLFGASKRSLD